MGDSFVVSESEAGLPLFQLVKSRLTNLSGKEARRMVEARECLVNARAALFCTYKVKRGDRVDIRRRAPLKREMDLLHECEDFLVIDKPSGVSSEEGMVAGTMLVHRLDKETSGVMILAKNAKTKGKLEQAFRSRKVYKSYVAIVSGEVQKGSGEIHSRLSPLHRYDGGVVMGTSTSGVVAHTKWTRLKTGQGMTMLACFPTTGRTHQIRVHLSSVGHPIFGDAKYGNKRLDLRLQLHAYEVKFALEHHYHFKAQLPRDLISII